MRTWLLGMQPCTVKLQVRLRVNVDFYKYVKVFLWHFYGVSGRCDHCWVEPVLNENRFAA